MRRGLVRIATACALTLSLATMTATMAPAAGATLRRERMLAWVNHSRTEHGVRKLVMRESIVKVARKHNLEMARKRSLVHSSDLGYKLRYVDWHTWGENIGAGVDPYGLYKAYMASPDHRANMLDRHFDHVGISFVLRGGILWSTMIFYG
ncbi:MAG: CAP domain-containing protein [Actinomycetota bacterium]